MVVNRNKSSKRRKSNAVLINASIVVSLVVLALIIWLSAHGSNKDYNDFAACLAEKGIVMAGSETCHFCKAQKEMFNDAFEESFIPAGGYKDCAIETEWCDDNGITGYPTWVTADGIRLVGVQQLEVLAKATGCGLN